jgi:hypothetical protein
MESCDFSETLGTAVRSQDERYEHEAGFLWTILPRYGRRPARVLGRELMRADNRNAANAERLPCWSDIRIYELAAGGFVVSVRHFQADDDGVEYQDLWQAENAASVIAMLRNHDIGASLIAGSLFSHRDVSLAAWQSLVGAIFGADV